MRLTLHGVSRLRWRIQKRKPLTAIAPHIWDSLTPPSGCDKRRKRVTLAHEALRPTEEILTVVPPIDPDSPKAKRPMASRTKPTLPPWRLL